MEDNIIKVIRNLLRLQIENKIYYTAIKDIRNILD